MPVDCVSDRIWPEVRLGVGKVLHGTRLLAYHSDASLGDRVQVVIVRRAELRPDVAFVAKGGEVAREER